MSLTATAIVAVVMGVVSLIKAPWGHAMQHCHNDRNIHSTYTIAKGICVGAVCCRHTQAKTLFKQIPTWVIVMEVLFLLVLITGWILTGVVLAEAASSSCEYMHAVVSVVLHTFATLIIIFEIFMGCCAWKSHKITCV